MDDPTSDLEQRRVYEVAALSKAAAIGLTREERLELAEYALRRDVPSFSDLTLAELSRLCDSLEGYRLVTALLELRVTG